MNYKYFNHSMRSQFIFMLYSLIVSLAYTQILVEINPFDDLFSLFNQLENNSRNQLPPKVFDFEQIQNNSPRRKNRGVFREVTIEVSPEGMTETTRTIDSDGNETVEVLQKGSDSLSDDPIIQMLSGGNLNKGKRGNAPINIFNSFDDMLESIIFDMIHDMESLEGLPSTSHNNAIHTIDDVQIEESLKKLTTEDLRLDDDFSIQTEPAPTPNANNNAKMAQDKSNESSKVQQDKIKDKETTEKKSPEESLMNARKKKIEEVKKEQPSKSMIAKFLKFLFYVVCLVSLIVALRYFLRSISLVPDSYEGRDILKGTTAEKEIKQVELTNKQDSKTE